jgi:glycosyltransferase involved in cell wall biosynthesis
MEDPVLGFFVRWIEELAKRVEQVEVICLKEGKHELPKNVHIHSLGKEQRTRNSGIYATRFLLLTWKLRNEYDAVFVHMNQEYILIAGWLWKLFGKRVYLWRNHYAGSWLTDFAASLCTKVFCTSKHSYTAKYKKTVFMPVGVDTDKFFLDEHVRRIPHSILFLARMASSKRPEMLIDALALLARSGIEFIADFYGSPLPQDSAYYEGLKGKVRSLGLENRISFYPGPPNYQAPDIFRAHEIFVNASPSGMLDKTIFEAVACGCAVLAASKDFAELAGQEFYFDSVSELNERLVSALTNPSARSLAVLVEENSLASLAKKLCNVIIPA